MVDLYFPLFNLQYSYLEKIMAIFFNMQVSWILILMAPRRECIKCRRDMKILKKNFADRSA